MSPGCTTYSSIAAFSMSPWNVLIAAVIACRGVADSLTLMATSPAAVSITKSTSVPANVRQKFPEPLVFFDFSGDEGSHPVVA